jgi:dephospho-CoA kinase
MLVIGLTGGIGMGKSTLARLFRRAGVPVFDDDAEVHRLQAKSGLALPAIARAFPGTVHGSILDRTALRTQVIGNDTAMRTLERIMHPLVKNAERRFVMQARRAGRAVVVLDIPLLFETGADYRVDLIVVASAPRPVQLTRILARGQLTRDQAVALIARQKPDADKRRRADVVIRTGLSRFHAVGALRRMLQSLPPVRSRRFSA